ncbi:YkuS family protein [Brevibacillus dissolubilis]|uniref:YkuS family protein n=1 Tax=Brevibacillus dissolubilis TaxID=1844116 RepID=UPI001115E2E2|nr:YkuS family protein [Brevibacillus dissolubilis]
MSRGKVAVEHSLKDVSKMLRDNGYDVVNLGNWQQTVDCVVITGLDENIMGIEDKSITGAPVISARGLTTMEVFHEVNERLTPYNHSQTPRVRD